MADSRKVVEYKVPRPIYTKVLRRLRKEKEKSKTVTEVLCRTPSHRRFAAVVAPNSSLYCLEAMKQALDDRNYRVLYEIVDKLLDKGEFYLNQQAHQYLYTAICHDPLIEDQREEFLLDFIVRVKKLNMTVKEYQEQEHTLKWEKVQIFNRPNTGDKSPEPPQFVVNKKIKTEKRSNETVAVN